MIVFWAHLLFIPAGIISRINGIISHFLWSGAKSERKYHLCSMADICKPKGSDGWGILDTQVFNGALLTKYFWRAISCPGLWNDIIKAKYFQGDVLLSISCNTLTFPRFIACIWRSFRKIIPLITPHRIWNFRDGSHIPIGATTLLQLAPENGPSRNLIHALSIRGILFYSQIILHWSHSAPIFKTAAHLGLEGAVVDHWIFFRDSLRQAGLCYATRGDKLVWGGPMRNRSLIVKDVYQYFINSSHMLQGPSVFCFFWKRKIPIKITIFRVAYMERPSPHMGQFEEAGSSWPGMVCFLFSCR